MPVYFGLSSCLSRPEHAPDSNGVNTTPENVGAYNVNCTHQNDIRPVHRGEAKHKMTAKELVSVRRLFKELEIIKNPYQEPQVKSMNCGMAYFPTTQ